MAGKAWTLLDVTFNVFNTNGENEFLKHWRIIEKSSHWSRMPNPTIEAKVLKLAFSVTMTENNYQKLQEMLKKEREILIYVFPEIFTNLPNLHVNVHLLQHVRNFATLTNIAVGIKKMVHYIFKVQVLRHLIDGWTDPRFSTRPNALIKFTADPNIYKILTSWYAMKNSSSIMNKEFEKHNGKKLEFYNSISYTIIKNDQELPEKSEGIAYAKIKLNFQHQANNNNYYAFFLFDWFQATNVLNSTLECPLYNIQKPEKSRWFQVFPITFVDHNSHVFFIHNCKDTCNNKHDEGNRCYILNEFYYNDEIGF
ncbi:hypothetical protein C1646_752679 [Rhizophagus diaphanus]|nr:hypothetical protein C1646_752679 [Rhizophagus diaphanus] [Rhizophagus sp. MUCL 43196]